MEEALKSTLEPEYFNRCHNFVSHVCASSYLLKVGLLPYVDSVDIGYDTSMKEIILPIDEKHYHSIKLQFDRAADEREAQKVLRHYNLQPNETAKRNLCKGIDGKLIDGGDNYGKPYRGDSPFASLNAKVQERIKERRERYARHCAEIGLC